MEASDSDDKSDSKEESESSDDEVDHMFEAENAWRLDLVWALGAGIGCGHCTLKPNAIQSIRFVATIKRWSMMSMIYIVEGS